MKNLALLAFCGFVFSVSAQTYNSPESVEFDYVNNRWFVANNGGNNLLTRSVSGTLAVFASGFSAGPHGLEIYGNTIYACDGSTLKGFDLSSGTQTMNLNLGATFLNGITSDGNGNLFVSDFSAKKIYRVNALNQTFNVMVSGLAKSPNGIIYDGGNNRLVFVNWGSNAPIMAVDLSDSTTSTLVTTSFSNIDGIAKDLNGNYYISTWGNNSIQKYSSNFTVGPTQIIGSLSSPADLFYNVISDTLAIPNSGSANNVVFVGFGTFSIEESIQANELIIFPNPTNESLLISNPKQLSLEVELYTISGRIIGPVIKSEEKISLNVSALKPGTYFLRIKNGDQFSTKKIILE